MSATIYARVPDSVKAAVEEYAHEGGMSLTGAVSLLLARGLKARQEEPDVLARLDAIEALIGALIEDRTPQP